MKFNQFPPQYARIADLLQPFQAYLVGGAVRDLLLDQPIHDLDFALPESSIPAARQVADALGGSFYIMDEERETARVILDDGDDPRLLVDFTLFQGRTIEEDLAARDFTITSMALEVGPEPKLIDPFQGSSDLQEGLIRATSEMALANDPLRCLRAVRMAAQLDFQIMGATIHQIRQHQAGLAAVSPERIRDEFFRILEGPRQAAAVLSLNALGLFSYLLPGRVGEDSAQRLRKLEDIWSQFLAPHDQDRAGDWFRGLLAHHLGRYREQIRAYLAETLVAGRSIHQLSLALPLLVSFEESGPCWFERGKAENLALSNKELDYLEQGAAAGVHFLNLSGDGRILQPLDVYRFFHSAGRAGPAGIFLGLAGEFGRQGIERERWIDRLSTARTLLEGFWERPAEWVDPPRILDGSDIIQGLKLQPGPRIGQLLEILREEQVRSGLRSPRKALAFLKGQLEDLDRTPS